MPLLESEVPHLYLERARGREGGSKTAWCSEYWRGNCPGRGQWQRESKESNRPQSRPECTKTAKKGMVSCTIDLKISKNTVLYFKVQYVHVTRYSPETFFEEFMNFKLFCYLSPCYVIPVQSFGSHSRPPAAWKRVKNRRSVKGVICTVNQSYKKTSRVLSILTC